MVNEIGKRARELFVAIYQQIALTSPICTRHFVTFYSTVVKVSHKKDIARRPGRDATYFSMRSKAGHFVANATSCGVILTAGVYHNAVILYKSRESRVNFREMCAVRARMRYGVFLGEFDIGKLNSSLCSLYAKCSQRSYDARKYPVMSPKAILLQLKYKYALWATHCVVFPRAFKTRFTRRTHHEISFRGFGSDLLIYEINAVVLSS